MSHRRPQQAGAAASVQDRTTTPTPVMTDGKTKRNTPVTEYEIRLCAYRKWESAGRPPGNGIQFWLAAKQELEQALANTTLEP